MSAVFTWIGHVAVAVGKFVWSKLRLKSSPAPDHSEFEFTLRVRRRSHKNKKNKPRSRQRIARMVSLDEKKEGGPND